MFAVLLVSGMTTILQAVRVWRIGAGHVLVMGTSGTFIAVCVAAMVQAGPALMATLIAVSSLFQFVLAGRLSLLRRIFTPVVSGTGNHAGRGRRHANSVRHADPGARGEPE